MTGTQPFTPDDAYCVYCHAPAAGSCAVCAALCCADCVELVGGITVPRATCHNCLAAGHAPAGIGLFLRRSAVVAAMIAAVLALLIYFAV